MNVISQQEPGLDSPTVLTWLSYSLKHVVDLEYLVPTKSRLIQTTSIQQALLIENT